MVGLNTIYPTQNDTGPDDANHDFHGIFILDDRSGCGGEEKRGMTLLDVAPTILDLLGLEVPPDMQGRIIT
jgi:predicted AlkP superfamily phosphohydrolase/phosphomutase